MPLLRNRLTPAQRVSLATWLIVLAAAPAVRFPLKFLAKIRESARDTYSEGVAQFALLRPFLPPGERIGFMSAVAGFTPDKDGRHFMAQYALSPQIIERSAAPLVIFDSEDRKAQPAEALASRWTLITDTGYGVKLYRTELRR